MINKLRKRLKLARKASDDDNADCAKVNGMGGFERKLHRCDSACGYQLTRGIQMLR